MIIKPRWAGNDSLFGRKSTFGASKTADVTVSASQHRHLRSCKPCKISRMWEGDLTNDPGCAKCGPKPRSTWFEKNKTFWKPVKREAAS